MAWESLNLQRMFILLFGHKDSSHRKVSREYQMSKHAPNKCALSQTGKTKRQQTTTACSQSMGTTMQVKAGCEIQIMLELALLPNRWNY